MKGADWDTGQRLLQSARQAVMVAWTRVVVMEVRRSSNLAWLNPSLIAYMCDLG